MEEDDVDIAAAMGFASFGGTKKRKFDHTNSPKAKVESSGANSTKLGMRTKKTAGEEAIENPFTEQVEQSQSHPPTSNANSSTQEVTANSGLAAFLARGQALPENPSITHRPSAEEDLSTTDMVSFGGPPISRAELNALRFGVQNERGDTAYFLPSFVEDPWDKLRKSGGERATGSLLKQDL
ncbi:Nn.00g109830.m01.CDS01 [Neocucurbitaria sp. VM-36]